jgi:hypothetical protein
MMRMSRRQNAASVVADLGTNVAKRPFRLAVVHALTMFSLATIVAPAYASDIADPGRFVTYDKQGLPANRVMRGLGEPDRIEKRGDGSQVFWYHWMIEQPQGSIAARGLAAFAFTNHNKLNGFEILTMDEHGKYVDSTLDAVLGLEKK